MTVQSCGRDDAPTCYHPVPMTKPIDILTVGEAAILLDRESSWVRRLCQLGRLPAIKLGNSWGVRRSDALRYGRQHPKLIRPQHR